MISGDWQQLIRVSGNESFLPKRLVDWSWKLFVCSATELLPSASKCVSRTTVKLWRNEQQKLAMGSTGCLEPATIPFQPIPTVILHNELHTKKQTKL